MSFIVTSCVEMPLEKGPEMALHDPATGETQVLTGKMMRFIHYGPFCNEDEAREYAQIVDGQPHELVAPVAP